MALATSFKRRYSKNFQVGVTYTLMFYKHDTGIGSAGFGAMQLNNFDINTDWATSKDFQRHTLRANGVWTLPKGFSFSAFFGYGSPNPVVHDQHERRSAGHRRHAHPERPDGHPAQQLLRRLVPDAGPAPVQGRAIGEVKMTGIAEVFNLYNHAQYTYNTLETSAASARGTARPDQPRTGQLAVKMSF